MSAVERQLLAHLDAARALLVVSGVSDASFSAVGLKRAHAALAEIGSQLARALPRAEHAEREPQPLSLSELPAEVLVHIVACLDDPRDVVAVRGASTLFRGRSPPRSLVERALYERAALRSEREPPAWVRSGASTWCHALLRNEAIALGGHGDALVASAGSAISAFVDADGRLLTCGGTAAQHAFEGEREVAMAALGHGALSAGLPGVVRVPLPRVVASLAGVRILAVSAGAWHTLALSCSGDVYAFGSGANGRLGLGDLQDQRRPHRIEALAARRAVGVSAGVAHSLVLTASGEVYSFGCGESGMLGHGDCLERRLPQRVAALGKTSCACVSAGAAHSLVVSRAGAVYSFGCGREGALGHADAADRLEPARIVGLSGARALGASAGGCHSLVVCAAGAVYSFGRGEDGALGHGDKASRRTPTRIDGLHGVHASSVSAGNAHSLVATRCGAVFAFGLGSFGQLGLSTLTEGLAPGRTSARPLLEEAAMGARGTGAAAAASLARRASAPGRVRPSTAGAVRAPPSCPPPLHAAVPRRVGALAGAHAVGVSAGTDSHSLVVLANGFVVSFGRGRGGRLGNLDSLNSDAPRGPSAVIVPASATQRQRALTRAANGGAGTQGADARPSSATPPAPPKLSYAPLTPLLLSLPLVDGPAGVPGRPPSSSSLTFVPPCPLLNFLGSQQVQELRRS